MNRRSKNNTQTGDERSAPDISVIIPAMNEAENITAVVTEIYTALRRIFCDRQIEILVADNNSTDATAQLASDAGACVISVLQAGYGAACWAACEQARGNILLFVDGDGSTCGADSLQLIDAIYNGADVAIGVRVNPEAGSMSAAQRVGNGLACRLMALLWGIPASDLGPYRAVRRCCFDDLQLQDRGFGWTVELQVKAALHRWQVREVAVQWRARAHGYSKIGGTLRGVVSAGIGILGKIARLWLKYPRRADTACYQVLDTECLYHRFSTTQASLQPLSLVQVSSPPVQETGNHSCSQTR